MAIPAKYVLYCDCPGAEFREEFDGSKIDYTDKTDDMTYCEYICENEWLYDDIGDCLRDNFDKFLDDYFTEDMIPASGYLCYDEVRVDAFGGDEPCLKDGLEFYLDAVSEDGTIIDTKEINIEDFVDMESQQEFLMECGFSGETDDYIEIALGKFVDESEWSFGLKDADNYIEDVSDWPEPQEDGSWVDDEGKTLKPCFWFGNGSDMWILDGEHLNDFWLSSYPENYVVEVQYDAFDGYCRDIPGFDEVKKSCPIKIEANDTPESIDKKIQAFFIKQYDKGYPSEHILHCEFPGAEFREEFDSLGFFMDDVEPYSYYLSDDISIYLEDNFNVEPFLDKFFTEENVPASGHICYDDVRMDLFGNRRFSINKDIKVYLDTIGSDGTIIDTEEINIGDFINLESKKEDLLESGLWDITDEYIKISFKKFIDKNDWQIALKSGKNFVKNIEEWPAPQEDGSWIDSHGNRLEPCIWFGNNKDRWNLNGNHLDFWLSDRPYRYVVEYDYEGFAGCYGGGIPGFENVIKSCPVTIEKSDTPESIDKKIQAFFVEKYKEVHT